MKNMILATSITLFPCALYAKSIFPERSRQDSADSVATCAQFQGLWEGSCMADGKEQQSKVQIFQDGCSQLSLYDFDYPIPMVYKTTSESGNEAGPFANSFSNVTRYSQWSDDGKTFSSKSFSSGSFTIEGRRTLSEGHENLILALRGAILTVNLEGKLVMESPDGNTSQSFKSDCQFKKK